MTIDRLVAEGEAVGLSLYAIFRRPAGWAIQWWDESRCRPPTPRPESGSLIRDQRGQTERMLEGLVVHGWSPTLEHAIAAELAILDLRAHGWTKETGRT